PFSYEQGFIHKLITLDTPFLGTQLAAQLNSSSTGCKLAFGISNMPVAGAIEDMVPGSPALQLLTQSGTPIPTATVIGMADTTETAVAEENAKRLFSAVCRNLLPSGGFQTLFAEPNDLLVGVRSQAATGLMLPSGNPPETSLQGYVHSVDPKLFSGG